MLTTVLLLSAGVGAFECREAFDYPDGAEGAPRWFAESVAWEVKDGALEYDAGAKTFAILEEAPHGRRVTIEATVTIEERRDTDWAVAGVALRRDGNHFWHLALIEAPDAQGNRRYVELCEMLDGGWLSESAEASRLTRLHEEGHAFPWQYGQPYRLRLTATPERIDGFVLDKAGVPRAHLAYAFDNRAVTAGQPALHCAQFRACFDDVVAVVEDTVPPPALTSAECPPYGVRSHSDVTAPATGFFYPKEINGRWWLIDPEGRGFYMVGADHVSYYVHWCEQLGYAPYARNMRAQYGSEEKWAVATAERLADWGFNTLPANHSGHLRHRDFAHIEFLSLGSAFSGVDDLCPKIHWTGFPNVFSPKWARHCDKVARRICAPNQNDPWLIGYFLDNELEWFGKNHQPWGLFAEAWKKPAAHTAKQAWVAFLREGLESPAAFEEHWGVAVDTFEALAAHVEPAGPLTEKARDMARQWVRRVAEQYFRTCAEAIRGRDPNHLILGCRFAGDAPDVWDVAGQYCDVVSFNMYPRVDVDRGVPPSVVETIEGWHGRAGKPLMITEWSFPALDSGLPCTHGAGMRVATQAQKAKCFTHFQTLMFSLPFMVGSNYFMWVDEPALGIASTFPEDSNYGLVNEQGEPYEELTQAARALNAQVYALHAAAERPQPARPPLLAGWVTELPQRKLPVPERGVYVSTGSLRLDGPTDEGHAWRLHRRGRLLAHLYPLLHQVTSESRWVPSNTARIVDLRRGDRTTVIDMELAHVVDRSQPVQAPEERPRAFRSLWRFHVPRDDSGWMATRCLWVENTDDGPWRLKEVFHYVDPRIGGAPDADVPLLADIPNYFRHGAAWVDTDAGLGVGCWYADDDAFGCRYWLDPAGGHHADLRQPVDVTLQPGQRHEMEPQPAFVFSIEDTSLAGFARALDALAKAVLKPPSQ